MGKVIAKGPKHGRLFPLQLSTQDRNLVTSALFSYEGHLSPLQLSTQDRNLVTSALFSDSNANNYQLSHNRLDHPHFRTL